MTIKPLIKPVANSIGALLVLASLIYIWRKADRLLGTIVYSDVTPIVVITVLLSALAYGAILLLLAIAWSKTARADQSISFIDMIIIYGRAVLAKYLPGSIFQYASRQFFGASKGLAQKDMMAASMLEIALHIIVASAVAAIFAILSGYAVLNGLAVLIICMLLLVLGHYRGFTAYNDAVMLQLFFFLAFAGIAFCNGLILLGSFEQSAILTAIFMTAWLAGFVVPLAPGGIGVREAVILALGGIFMPADILLFFAALTRIITLLGDVLFGLAGYCAALADARIKRQASLRQ